MISLTQRLVSAGLLATAAFAASAQAPAAPATAPGAPAAEQRMDRQQRDGKFFERMQARHAQRQAALKAKLNLSAAQEGAWSTYTAATAPPARPPQRPDRAEFEKLTTPQRIDRMQARQAERQAMFAKRADATKSFYAALSPEQQKTFDTESLAMMRHGPRDGQDHHGHRPPPPAKG
ncbi:Spy/CpxP family protein refolding chaperone [Variovorax sp. dw_954]|uniref:Spy/CpxP family protein refolding chaperone n=1 Tax=Variovorax sp. dw_954 TaxID=2720078 RepID=UPI001BD37366|nr:Spy/CpxP family protein refolding chaperone [Variovorax sp. dw_954]